MEKTKPLINLWTLFPSIGIKDMAWPDNSQNIGLILFNGHCTLSQTLKSHLALLLNTPRNELILKKCLRIHQTLLKGIQLV